MTSPYTSRSPAASPALSARRLSRPPSPLFLGSHSRKSSSVSVRRSTSPTRHQSRPSLSSRRSSLVDITTDGQPVLSVNFGHEWRWSLTYASVLHHACLLLTLRNLLSRWPTLSLPNMALLLVCASTLEARAKAEKLGLRKTSLVLCSLLLATTLLMGFTGAEQAAYKAATGRKGSVRTDGMQRRAEKVSCLGGEHRKVAVQVQDGPVLLPNWLPQRCKQDTSSPELMKLFETAQALLEPEQNELPISLDALCQTAVAVNGQGWTGSIHVRSTDFRKAQQAAAVAAVVLCGSDTIKER